MTDRHATQCESYVRFDPVLKSLTVKMATSTFIESLENLEYSMSPSPDLEEHILVLLIDV
jgi:hypothetical protein